MRITSSCGPQHSRCRVEAIQEPLAIKNQENAVPHFDYADCEYDIRSDMPEAYRSAWEKIASPGNWWSGEDRVAIAAEVRAARDCELCKERKQALSPFSVKGSHSVRTNLPESAIDAVHRLTTDASRLTKSWLADSNANGLTNEKYVELLGIVVTVISIDAFHRAMGFELEPLPVPLSGDPDGYRPATAVEGDAWVARISAEKADGDELDLYDGMKQTGNVISAMSLVPDSVRLLKLVSAVQYMEPHQVADPSTNGGRVISRPQIELLAGRVSALSDCFY
jgi:hypothetical protein